LTESEKGYNDHPETKPILPRNPNSCVDPNFPP
jgi:hypothetical protein